MSYYAQFDNKAAGDVATNSGWRDLCNWVAELEGVEELRHLTEHGWSENLDDVASELEAAIKSGKPEQDVADTASGLLAQLDEHSDADVVVITDGAGSEGDDDDD